MKKTMMLAMVGLVSFNVSATEAYSCSFGVTLNHVFGGEATAKSSKVKSLDISRDSVSTYVYSIDGGKARVAGKWTDIRATFLKVKSNRFSKLGKSVIFVEKQGEFPSTTIISNNKAVRTTVFDQGAGAIQSYTSYGSCIKTII